METWRDLANTLTVELMAPAGKPAEGGEVKKEGKKSKMTDQFAFEQLDGWWYFTPFPLLANVDSGCHLAFLTSRNCSATTCCSFPGQMSMLSPPPKFSECPRFSPLGCRVQLEPTPSSLVCMATISGEHPGDSSRFTHRAFWNDSAK